MAQDPNDTSNKRRDVLDESEKKRDEPDRKRRRLESNQSDKRNDSKLNSLLTLLQSYEIHTPVRLRRRSLYIPCYLFYSNYIIIEMIAQLERNSNFSRFMQLNYCSAQMLNFYFNFVGLLQLYRIVEDRGDLPIEDRAALIEIEKRTNGFDIPITPLVYISLQALGNYHHSEYGIFGPNYPDVTMDHNHYMRYTEQNWRYRIPNLLYLWKQMEDSSRAVASEGYKRMFTEGANIPIGPTAAASTDFTEDFYLWPGVRKQFFFENNILGKIRQLYSSIGVKQSNQVGHLTFAAQRVGMREILLLDYIRSGEMAILFDAVRRVLTKTHENVFKLSDVPLSAGFSSIVQSTMTNDFPDMDQHRDNGLPAIEIKHEALFNIEEPAFRIAMGGSFNLAFSTNYTPIAAVNGPGVYGFEGNTSTNYYLSVNRGSIRYQTTSAETVSLYKADAAVGDFKSKFDR